MPIGGGGGQPPPYLYRPKIGSDYDYISLVANESKNILVGFGIRAQGTGGQYVLTAWNMKDGSQVWQVDKPIRPAENNYYLLYKINSGLPEYSNLDQLPWYAGATTKLQFAKSLILIEEKIIFTYEYISSKNYTDYTLGYEMISATHLGDPALTPISSAQYKYVVDQGEQDLSRQDIRKIGIDVYDINKGELLKSIDVESPTITDGLSPDEAKFAPIKGVPSSPATVNLTYEPIYDSPGHISGYNMTSAAASGPVIDYLVDGGNPNYFVNMFFSGPYDSTFYRNERQNFPKPAVSSDVRPWSAQENARPFVITDTYNQNYLEFGIETSKTVRFLNGDFIVNISEIARMDLTDYSIKRERVGIACPPVTLRYGSSGASLINNEPSLEAALQAMNVPNQKVGNYYGWASDSSGGMLCKGVTWALYLDFYHSIINYTGDPSDFDDPDNIIGYRVFSARDFDGKILWSHSTNYRPLDSNADLANQFSAYFSGEVAIVIWNKPDSNGIEIIRYEKTFDEKINKWVEILGKKIPLSMQQLFQQYYRPFTVAEVPDAGYNYQNDIADQNLTQAIVAGKDASRRQAIWYRTKDNFLARIEWLQ